MTLDYVPCIDILAGSTLMRHIQTNVDDNNQPFRKKKTYWSTIIYRILLITDADWARRLYCGIFGSYERSFSGFSHVVGWYDPTVT